MREKAYAKVNITLDVVGKREDGYHLLKMIMQNIDIYDVITIEKIESGEVDKTLDASRKIIENYIDKNGNVLDKKHQIDLFNKLRAINRGKISLINLLKKLDINYSYQGDGDWKDIVVG